MAEISICPPLEPTSIKEAYEKIKSHIHKTPLITSQSLNAIASHPNPAAFLSSSPPPLHPNNNDEPNSANANSTGLTEPATPQFNLFFKCENQQKIGAFKARGAFHAITHLIETLGLDTLRSRGVTTHSSGNHAQALALAAHTYNVPSYIVMPTISTPSKIAGTRVYTANVVFSGSTSDEREAKVKEVIEETGAILVPPYDHPDIILGQGTAALEMESQFQETSGQSNAHFDAVLTPLGGGGLLSGTATWFSHTNSNTKSDTTASTGSTQNSNATTGLYRPRPTGKTLVFGTEPSFSGANDAQQGLSQTPPKRVEHVKSLTIADGLRTPVGLIPWSIVTDKSKIQGVYSATEREIKHALRLMMERGKIFVEPSAVVPLAVVLFCAEFRRFVAELQRSETQSESENGGDGKVRPWNVGIILSGGNTTVEAVVKLFSETEEEHDVATASSGVAAAATAGGSIVNGQRVTATIGLDGSQKVEDVAG